MKSMVWLLLITQLTQGKRKTTLPPIIVHNLYLSGITNYEPENSIDPQYSDSFDGNNINPPCHHHHHPVQPEPPPQQPLPPSIIPMPYLIPYYVVLMTSTDKPSSQSQPQITVANVTKENPTKQRLKKRITPTTTTAQLEAATPETKTTDSRISTHHLMSTKQMKKTEELKPKKINQHSKDDVLDVNYLSEEEPHISDEAHVDLTTSNIIADLNKPTNDNSIGDNTSEVIKDYIDAVEKLEWENNITKSEQIDDALNYLSVIENKIQKQDAAEYLDDESITLEETEYVGPINKTSIETTKCQYSSKTCKDNNGETHLCYQKIRRKYSDNFQEPVSLPTKPQKNRPGKNKRVARETMPKRKRKKHISEIDKKITKSVGSDVKSSMVKKINKHLNKRKKLEKVRTREQLQRYLFAKISKIFIEKQRKNKETLRRKKRYGKNRVIHLLKRIIAEIQKRKHSVTKFNKLVKKKHKATTDPTSLEQDIYPFTDTASNREDYKHILLSNKRYDAILSITTPNEGSGETSQITQASSTFEPKVPTSNTHVKKIARQEPFEELQYLTNEYEPSLQNINKAVKELNEISKELSSELTHDYTIPTWEKAKSSTPEWLADMIKKAVDEYALKKYENVDSYYSDY